MHHQAPGLSLAHGIGHDASDASPLGFVRLGFEHMLLGWDHLLFIAGVIVVCRNWWLAAKMITVFVIGHSTTLILASVLGVGLDPTLVDLVIAVSVIFVGYFAVSGREINFRLFGAIVFGFGLIHGLGLASRLEDIGLPDEGKLARVIGFNIGIELGQLTAVLAFAAIAYVASQVLDDTSRAGLVAGGVVLLGGVAAVVFVLFRMLNPPFGEPTELALPARSTCTLAERTAAFSTLGGGHPAQSFTEPSDRAPMDDFSHTIVDGYLIVLYPQSASTDDTDTLRTWVNSENGATVFSGPNPETTDRFEAHTLYETLSCEELEMGPLVDFQTAWLATLDGGVR